MKPGSSNVTARRDRAKVIVFGCALGIEAIRQLLRSVRIDRPVGF